MMADALSSMDSDQDEASQSQMGDTGFDNDLEQGKLDQPKIDRCTPNRREGTTCNEYMATEKHFRIGAEKPFPPTLPDPEKYIVEFDGPEDPAHPHNWDSTTKFCIAFSACFGTFTASLCSAIFAAGISGSSKEFNVSTEVATLGTTLYILGFASGPLIWAPASELIGRRWPLTIGMLGGGIFIISSAVAKDIQTLIICRFFSGVFGASQLSVVPAVLADLYNTIQRGYAITLYSLAVFGGPFCAPFTGGFIATSSLGWRWVLYIPAFITFLGAALDVIWLKETYAAVILSKKASEIRRASHNWGIHARLDDVELNLHELIHKNLTRPIRMLITEPILFLISLYMSFIYGLVYALLEAYPYVFENVYGMSPGVGGLTFIGLLIGVCLACGYILLQFRIYNEKLIANNNVPIPEWRLPPVKIGAVLFTVGLFWFGWTGFRSSIHWMAPTASGVLIGFGVLCIFLPCFNYILDVYLQLAASTVAANIIFRSAVAAVFPLFSRQMFQNLGVQWACTLLGGFAAIMIPIPFAFERYGPWLRGKSKLAP